MIKKVLGIILPTVFSSTVLACFNDAGCPRGNVCLKTGRVMGICVSQAMPLYGNTPTYGQGTIQTPSVPTPQTGTLTPVPIPSSPASQGTYNQTNPSQLPSVPTAPREISGTCYSTVTCPSGFSCVKAAGENIGFCTRSP